MDRQLGQCECGKVSFEIKIATKDVVFCHCGQCRRTSGHLWASVLIDDDDFELVTDSMLKWYTSSDFAKRGFCAACGSSLFYKMNDEAAIAVAVGCLDQPTGLKPGKHIFVADKGDYYHIADDLPQLEKF